MDQLKTLGIISAVSDQWRKIAIRTGQADDDLDEFDEKTACQRVFIKWIINGGHPPMYPLTWQGLYDLLCDVDHHGVANTVADKKIAEGVLVVKRSQDLFKGTQRLYLSIP